MFTKLWKPINAAIPTQISLPEISLALFAIKRISIVIKNINAIITTEPTKPNSSPATAKIKSVCGSEI